MSGLPTLTFTLRKAAASVASRTAQGAVALIVKDAASGAAGVYTVYQESDIPAALGADNKAFIKRALMGHINRPSVVYVSVIGTSGTVSTGFAALAAYSYDYLAGPPDITASDATALAGLVKAGGDTSFVFKNDTCFVFLVVLPSAFIALQLGAPVWVVMACLKCDQILKCIVAAIKINRFRWMKNLTRPA